jgi:hypothetical protein
LKNPFGWPGPNIGLCAGARPGDLFGKAAQSHHE